MTEKLLVSEYVSFGKGDGQELRDRYVINNTPEERQEIIDNIYYNETYDSEEEFVNGKSDMFQYDRYGGDWDEPTGGFIFVETKEQAIKRIDEKAESEKRSIVAYFRNNK